MMDESALAKKAERAARARDILDNDLFKEAFDTLQAEYIAAWKITHFKNAAGREQLFLAVNILEKIRNHFGKVMADGRMAQRDLAQISHPKQ